MAAADGGRKAAFIHVDPHFPRRCARSRQWPYARRWRGSRSRYPSVFVAAHAQALKGVTPPVARDTPNWRARSRNVQSECGFTCARNASQSTRRWPRSRPGTRSCNSGRKTSCDERRLPPVFRDPLDPALFAAETLLQPPAARRCRRIARTNWFCTRILTARARRIFWPRTIAPTGRARTGSISPSCSATAGLWRR